ncbi:Fur family transcriptional regulator [Candidatus Riflebacteria bacterium]
MHTRKKVTNKEIIERLRGVNIQPTAQRIAICQYVMNSFEHPTVDDIKHWTDENFPKLSLATVYNTVNTLVEAGLIQGIRFPNQEKMVFDSNPFTHYHFLDENTGKIYDLDDKNVNIELKIPGKFKVKEVEVLVRGHIG